MVVHSDWKRVTVEMDLVALRIAMGALLQGLIASLLSKATKVIVINRFFNIVSSAQVKKKKFCIKCKLGKNITKH
jgi:hypothetical protein